MKIRIKDLSVEMEVKTRGIELQVNSTGEKEQQLGDLVVKNSGLVWCEGRTLPQNGIKIKWETFISWAKEQNSKKKENRKAPTGNE